MPQHERGDHLGPVRQVHLGGTLTALSRPIGDQDLRGLRPGSGRPCPGAVTACRRGNECACASIAYGVRRLLGDETFSCAQPPDLLPWPSP
jgi:hypothetical protein